MPVEIAQLVRDHHAAVYRYAYRLCGSTVDAEDLTQQAFLLAQQKIGQLRDLRSLRSWLFSILRNCFLMSRRQRIPIPAGNLEIDLANVPEETTSEQIDTAQLQSAISSLPDELKVVLGMFYFERCSYREIAAQLAIPIGTVMSRLSRAKGHLRRQLLPTGERTVDGRSAGAWNPRELIP